ncbi:MAG: hypothetical protein DWQ05_18730 [Calditrichaeota bacterium]|nr:MAG: hypothetical protein DWQ05_18730 [Calditrichota bacterium]
MLSDSTPRARIFVNEITTPWIQNLDLLFERSFNFGQFRTRWFIAIQNVFNRQNEHHVYWRTGKTTDDGSFSTTWPELVDIYKANYGAEWQELYQKINIEHRQHYALEQGGDLFGHPREIRFGVALDFSR